MTKRRPGLSNANPTIAVRNWVGRKCSADERLVRALALARAAMALALRTAEISGLLGSKADDLGTATDAVTALYYRAASEDADRYIQRVHAAAVAGDEQAIRIVDAWAALDGRCVR